MVIFLKYTKKQSVYNAIVNSLLQEIKMKVEAAFLFIAPNTDKNKHKALIQTEILNLNVVGVSTYTEACEVAKQLVAGGVKAIELCAGFGNEGVALVKRAVENKAYVGAVKFDCHPGFDFKSGDEIFG